ncbi:MAG TPA: hypothetical protein VGF39_15755 [Stellaceae bacterium]|jgi:hypothetical protein
MFEWPLDKLALINRALDQTNDNNVAVADDGSDEWKAASSPYETSLASICERHPWCWTRTMRVLQPAPNPPSDPYWDTAYNLPADLVHLIYARIEDLPCIYQIMKGPDGSPKQLCLNAQGGPPAPIPPQVPAPVSILYISSNTSDIQNATPLLVEALLKFTIAGIYRGHHEDEDRATKMDAEAAIVLREAMARHDQQMPKRALYNSRLAASRRMRRPWPPTPGGWFGTGVPSVGNVAGGAPAPPSSSSPTPTCPPPVWD